MYWWRSLKDRGANGRVNLVSVVSSSSSWEGRWMGFLRIVKFDIVGIRLFFHFILKMKFFEKANSQNFLTTKVISLFFFRLVYKHISIGWQSSEKK
ncbi:hypothetical protein LOAG_13058 [Loa loa]|uniref:Uncharacterized protein n=1 Tax=Loa loa TaxID=7209 RepID=A0A1S0TKN5_LOALO|nr:hypothetical protein LOAG_13058 [Loa loa]EFO15453.1 hypothetical protein LOAG_13058 [Loa loa]